MLLSCRWLLPASVDVPASCRLISAVAAHIGKHCGIVPLEEPFHQWLNTVRVEVDCIVTATAAIHIVVGERVLPHADLYSRHIT
jgi:hypothetical protein